jgi:hypothetical protein
MATILHRLAIPSSARRITLPSGAETVVQPNQIIAWVCLSPPGLTRPPPGAWRFPAVLDTGCGYPFVLHEMHWRNWVGPITQYLGELPTGRVYGHPALRRRASLWIYPNRPDDFAEILPGRDPARLEIEDRIGVTISNVLEEAPTTAADVGRRQQPTLARPRLPLIGLPALKLNNLILTVDAGRGHVRLRRARRLWFLRW